MLKENAAKALEDLVRLTASPHRKWGHFPLQKSIEFKRDMVIVNRLLARSNASAEKLRAAYHMISAYYIDQQSVQSAPM